MATGRPAGSGDNVKPRAPCHRSPKPKHPRPLLSKSIALTKPAPPRTRDIASIALPVRRARARIAPAAIEIPPRESVIRSHHARGARRPATASRSAAGAARAAGRCDPVVSFSRPKAAHSTVALARTGAPVGRGSAAPRHKLRGIWRYDAYGQDLVLTTYIRARSYHGGDLALSAL